MKILIVGAGAVGLVYGRHLAAAGQQVTFFVKPKYAADLVSGVRLTKHHWLGKPSTTEHWQDFGVITDLAEVAAQDWDQVWLTIPTDAVRSKLTKKMLAVIGAATVVCLTPGDQDWLRSEISGELVIGMIPFLSYQAPLPGENIPSGIAFLLPPAPTPVSGKNATEVVAGLQRSGLAAKQVFRDEVTGGLDGVLICLVAGLESHGWQLAGFANSPEFRLAKQAALESAEVLSASRFTKRLVKIGLRPSLVSIGLRFAKFLFPIPLQPYLQYHFSKVGNQTTVLLADYQQLAPSNSAIEKLREKLVANRKISK